MLNSPPSIKRAQKNLKKKTQEGKILSYTTIMHPPKGFDAPRTIGLIELEDGSKVLGQLTSSKVLIGQKVAPRMRLTQVNQQGLRTYDVCFEPLEGQMVKEKEFTGYIIAISGPSGVGKTTISKILTTKVGDYAVKVPILTTREPSDQDEGEYEYINQREFDALKKQGKLASYSRIPSSTQNRWYGYRRGDIESIWEKHKIPIVVTEIGLLQDLVRTYNRRSILSFGLLPPGKSKRHMLSCLLHRLRSRGRDTEAAIRERLKNAEKDLQFFKDSSSLFDDLIVNEDLDTVIGMLKGRILAKNEV